MGEENNCLKTPEVKNYTDSYGKKYTKQRLFESIYYFNSNQSFGNGAAPGSWMNAVEQMGKWYELNVHTYQSGNTGKATGNRKSYECPLINKTVQDDCSSFVKACLQFYGLKEIDHVYMCTSSMQPNSEFDKVLRAAGFQYLPYSELDRRPGDILCGGPATHTEIYAGTFGGKHKSWSWGNIHDGQNGHSGMPCPFASISSKGGYKHIWRL